MVNYYKLAVKKNPAGSPGLASQAGKDPCKSTRSRKVRMRGADRGDLTKEAPRVSVF
jgi:hypothetical protein